MRQQLTEWLRWADIASMVACALSLSLTGLFRVYPSFFALLLLGILTATASLQVPPESKEYFLLFLIDTVANWVLWTLIASSLSQKILQDFAGLASIGRWALRISVPATLAIVALTASLNSSPYTFTSAVRPLMYTADRTATVAVALFLLTLCGLMAWFSVPVARNVVRLCLGLEVIFATRSAARALAVALGPQVMAILNPWLLACTASVYLCLAWMLNQEGEKVSATAGTSPPEGALEDSLRRLGGLSKKASNSE